MTYYSRAEWGGRNPSAGPLGPVGTTVIHHTAGPNPPHAFSAARWRQLEAGEVAAGYTSLAYHFGVCPNGDMVEIRGWGQRGAATGGVNGSTIAIVFDGYFHPPYNEQPTAEAIASAGMIVAEGRARGFLTSPNCEGHRTMTAGTQWATACPGDNLFDDVGRIEAIGAGGGAGTPAPRRQRSVPEMLQYRLAGNRYYKFFPLCPDNIAQGFNAGVDAAGNPKLDGRWSANKNQGVPSFDGGGSGYNELLFLADVKDALRAQGRIKPGMTKEQEQVLIMAAIG